MFFRSKRVWLLRVIRGLTCLARGVYREFNANELSENQNSAEVLLILGGSRTRELACASSFSGEGFLLLSSGAATQTELACASGINIQRVCLDGRAVCTVTNFTSIVDDLERHSCRSLAIATSPSHRRRAFLVSCIVLGSRGIQIHSKCCSGNNDRNADGTIAVRESNLRVCRDVARSLLWLFVGWDGGNVARFWYPERQRQASACSQEPLSLAIERATVEFMTQPR